MKILIAAALALTAYVALIVLADLGLRDGPTKTGNYTLPAQADSGLVCQLIDVDSLNPLQMTVDFGLLWGATVTLFIEGQLPDSLDAEVKTTQWTQTLKAQVEGARMLEAQIDRSTGETTMSYQAALWRTARGFCHPGPTNVRPPKTIPPVFPVCRPQDFQSDADLEEGAREGDAEFTAALAGRYPDAPKCTLPPESLAAKLQDDGFREKWVAAHQPTKR